MLVRLVYSSNLNESVSWHDILDIVKSARVYNAENNITGLLLSYEKQVLQVLEGDAANITPLFATIAQDKRHDLVQLLWVEQVFERHFAKWKMKEVSIERLAQAQFGWIKELMTEKNDEYHLPHECMAAYTILRTVYEITTDT